MGPLLAKFSLWQMSKEAESLNTGGIVIFEKGEGF